MLDTNCLWILEMYLLR